MNSQLNPCFSTHPLIPCFISPHSLPEVWSGSSKRYQPWLYKIGNTTDGSYVELAIDPTYLGLVLSERSLQLTTNLPYRILPSIFEHGLATPDSQPVIEKWLAKATSMIAESGGRRLLQYYKQRASGKKEELPLVALEWAELHCQLKDLTSAELTEIVQSLVLCGTLLCGEQSLRDFNSTVLFGLLLSRAKTLPPAKDDQQIIPILRSLFVAPAENDEPHEEHGIDTSLPFFKNLQLCGSFLGVDWNLGKYNIDESVIEMLQKTAAFPYDHQHTKSLIGTLQSRMLWMFPQISVEGFPPRLAWWLNPIQARELNSFLHSSKPVFPDPEDTPGAFLVWCMINDVNIYEIGLWTKSDHGKNVLKWLRIALRSGQPQVFVGSMFAMLSYYRLSCSKDLAVNIRGDFESPSVEYVEWESQGDSEDQQFSISLVNEEDISDLLLTQWNRFLETDEDPGMIIDLVYPSFCRVLMKLIRKTSLHFCKDWISPCHSQSVEAYPKVEEYFKNRLA